jgi:hypothetical protein
MIKVKFIDNIKDKNNNNIYELAPFKIIQTNSKSKLLCKEYFYNELFGTSVIKILEEEFDVVMTNNLNEFSKFKNDLDSKEYWKVYHILFNWMSIENWCYILDEKYVLIKLDNDECSYLINSIKNFNFIEKLNKIVKEFDSGVFVKLEHGSTKQDFRPYEVFTGDELFEQISNSKNCINQLKTQNKKDHYLFIKKWNNKIKKENEFRVFIDNKKISGISQQYINEVYPFMTSIISQIPEQVLNSIQKLWNSIVHKIEYKTCVLDVFISIIDEDNIECELIEINGYGRWGPAGSSLYNWLTDDPISNSLELRIRI